MAATRWLHKVCYLSFSARTGYPFDGPLVRWGDAGDGCVTQSALVSLSRGDAVFDTCLPYGSFSY